MVAKKYIANDAGELVEVFATQTSAGAGDAGEIVALNESGTIDETMMPTGIGADTASVQASESLAAGDLVNIHDAAGEFRVRKADASAAGKEAHGFVLAGAASGAQATVYFEGNDNQVAGLTPGKKYLSATTPGAATSVVPTGAGQIVQQVGYAPSATVLNFQAHVPIVLA